MLLALIAAAYADDFAPRPYTPEQIRAAMPVGTVIEFKVDEVGKPTVITHMTVTAADATGATFSTQDLDANHKLVTDEGSKANTWVELQGHATFPAAATTRTDDQVDVPAGHFATWLYVVKRDGPDGPEVDRFEFAKDMAGPPVKMEVQVAGKVTSTMVMLVRKPVPPK